MMLRRFQDWAVRVLLTRPPGSFPRLSWAALSACSLSCDENSRCRASFPSRQTANANRVRCLASVLRGQVFSGLLPLSGAGLLFLARSRFGPPKAARHIGTFLTGPAKVADPLTRRCRIYERTESV